MFLFGDAYIYFIFCVFYALKGQNKGIHLLNEFPFLLGMYEFHTVGNYAPDISIFHSSSDLNQRLPGL